MATVITELDTIGGKKEDDWLLNVTVTHASTAVDIRAAAADYQHGIKKITVTGVLAGTEWFKILNGSDILIGPVILATGVPWKCKFKDTIYCTRGNALKLITKSDFPLHCLIEGDTGEPVSSPSPSASPS